MLRRLHQVAQFAFPQRDAILVILGFTLAVAAISAIEPLILKSIFDELAEDQEFRALFLSVAALLGLVHLRRHHDLVQRPALCDLSRHRGLDHAAP
jgi:hypothetical protein